MPKFYLREFTPDRTEDSQLFVVDLIVRRAFKASPTNVCAERDFNRIESPTLPSDALETQLAQFEAKAADAVRELISSRKQVSPDAWLWVLNFMSVLAARNPAVRNAMTRFVTESMLRELDKTTASPEVYKETMEAAIAAGHVDPSANMDFEAHRQFIAERRFKMTFDPGYFVVGEFGAQDAVLKALDKRRWLLLEAPPDSGGFITSDRPVCLCHSDGSYPWAEKPLGFAVPGTMVIFPICPSLAAVGTFDGRQGITTASRKVVAKANMTIVQNCMRQVFAPHDRFEVGPPMDGKYVVGAGVINMISGRVEA